MTVERGSGLQLRSSVSAVERSSPFIYSKATKSMTNWSGEKWADRLSSVEIDHSFESYVEASPRFSASSFCRNHARMIRIPRLRPDISPTVHHADLLPFRPKNLQIREIHLRRHPRHCHRRPTICDLQYHHDYRCQQQLVVS